MIQALLIAAAALSAAWFFVHLILGGREIAGPLRASDLPPVVRDTSYLCWHITSWTIAAMALFFLLALLTGEAAYGVAAMLLALGTAGVGIVMAPLIGISYRVLPQGWLFVPVALLGGLALWL